MNKIIDALKDWGCDINGAMERFMNDEELYLSCIDILISDEAFALLGSALESGNIKEAFDSAHTLKGIIGNMGITPMYEIITKITEPLRNGIGNGLMPLYIELILASNKLREISEISTDTNIH